MDLEVPRSSRGSGTNKSSSILINPPAAKRCLWPHFSWLIERMYATADDAALAALQLAPGNALLEIGFGAGAFLEIAAHRMKYGAIAGVDPEPVMVKMAQGKLSAFESCFTIDLRCADDRNLPWPGAHFDRIAAIHSFQFWENPASSLRSLKALLRSDGILCLALRKYGEHPPEWLPNPLARQSDATAQTIRCLTEAGFRDVECFLSLSSSDIIRCVG